MVKIRQSKILVVGAGAIGGIIAAFLTRAGQNVQLVTKYPDLADRIRESGIQVSGIKGSFTFPVPAVATIDEAEGEFDFVIIATKAYDLIYPAVEAVERLTPNGKIVTIQNGIVEEHIAAVVGREKVIGCVVGWGATLESPGVMRMTSGGEFVIGSLDGESKEELKVLKEILNRFLKTTIVDDIYAHLYSKLIINMCVTTLGAISSYNVGQMLWKRQFRHLIVQIVREAIDVADAMGMRVPFYAEKLNYYYLAKQVSFFPSIIKHIVMLDFGWKYRNLKSSSLQSLERGKKTEISYMNGYVVKKGMELSVKTPLNTILVEYVSQIEKGMFDTTPMNFCSQEFKPFYPKFACPFKIKKSTDPALF